MKNMLNIFCPFYEFKLEDIVKQGYSSKLLYLRNGTEIISSFLFLLFNNKISS